MIKEYFTADRTAHPNAAEHRWAIIYNPTPGGRLNSDGTRSYSMCFPALLLTDYVSNPEAVAKSIAADLNKAKHEEMAREAAEGTGEAG